MRALIEKTNESLSSVIPITAIVLLLSISIAPLTPGALILFLFGAVLLVAGMGLFTLGVDMSMLPMGEGVGVELAKRKRMGIPLLVCFILGVVITGAPGETMNAECRIAVGGGAHPPAGGRWRDRKSVV